MQCEHCGREIADDSYSCKYCGGIFGSQNTIELPTKLDAEKEKAPWKIPVLIVSIVLSVAIVFSTVAIVAIKRKKHSGYEESTTVGINTIITTEEPIVGDVVLVDETTDTEESETDDKKTTTEKETEKTSNFEKNRRLYEKYLKNGFLDECASYSEIESVNSQMIDLNNDKVYELLLEIHFEYGDIHYYLLGLSNGKNVVVLKRAEYPGGNGLGDFIYISRDADTGRPLIVFESFYRSGVYEASFTYEVYTYNGRSLSQIKLLHEVHFNVDEGYEHRFIELQEETSQYEVERIDDNTIDVRYFTIDGSYVPRDDYENAYNRYVKPKNMFEDRFVAGTPSNPLPY